MNKIILLLLVPIFLVGCVSSQAAVNDPASRTPTQVQSQLTPSSPKTDLNEVGQVPDLAKYSEAWNTGDLQVIRALYAPEARYFYDTDLEDFAQGHSVDPLVSSTPFAQRASEVQGSSLRIAGEPIGVYGKLAAFAYTRETNTGQEKGITLLRLEDGRILLQVDIPSRDDSGDAQTGKKVDLANLMEVWNTSDIDSANNIYSQKAVILSDEDLMQASWRDFTEPPKLDHLLTQFKGWDPQVIGEPITVGNTIIFPWKWFNQDYPVGYGIRAIQVGEEGVSKDIRFVIRPWETESPFLTP